MPTIRDALTTAKTQLHQSDTASLDAQVLLCDVLDVGRAYLFAHGDESLSFEQFEQFEQVIQRRVRGEPIAYILGTQGFYDVELMITPAVLIPRPETELLLEDALRLMEDKADPTVADIGTGSGALAVTFAKHKPQSRVYAVDVSRDALNIARQNIGKYSVSVTTLHGNLAQPLIDNNIKLDLLMANLPYIRTDEMDDLAVSVYEPHLALDGGVDGLDLVRELFTQLSQVCNDGAWVLLEIGAEQGDSLKQLVQDVFDVRCEIIKDYAKLDRIGRFQL